MSSAITVNGVHAAVTGAFATTAKGLLRNALRGGTLQKLLQFCLLLRKNRRSRHSLTQLKAAATEKKPPRWYMTFLSQFHALYRLLRRMALPYSNCGSGYNWGIMSCRQRHKVGVLGQCNTKQESIHHRAGLAAHNLWNTMHRRQVCIWFDNLRRYRSGADPHSPDLTLNCTAVAFCTLLPYLHTGVYRSWPKLRPGYQRLLMTSFAHIEHFLIVLMWPTKVFREFGFVLLWILPEKMFVPSTGDPFSCLSSAPAHTKSFCNSWLICHVWNTAPDTVFRCLWT